MSTITLRNTKGSPLTNTEIDDNFSNLNTDKYESGDSPSFAGLTVASDSTYAIDVSRLSAGNTTLRITGGSTAGNDSVLRADIGNTTGTSAVYFGDTDTNGIGRIAYEHNGDYMRFYTSSAEAMRIDDSGNVGIGTTSPSYDFVVSNGGASGIEIGAGYSGTKNLVQHYNRSGSAYVDVDNVAAQHIFKIGTSEAMRIDSSSNVGIGTSSPSVLLDLTSTNPIIRLTDSDTGVDTDISAANSSGSLFLQIDKNNTAASSHLQVEIDGSEKMRVTDTGRVGIGTTAPLTDLVTVGTTMATSQAFVGSVSDTTYSGGIINLSNTSRSVGITADPNNSGASSILTFSVDGTERMRIDSDGDVGIGAAAPSGYRLEVTQDTAAALYTRTYNADTTSTSHIVHQYRVNNDSASIYLQFGDATSASAGQMQYDNSTDSFYWASDGIQKFLMESDGDFHADGDVIAYSTTVSDKRLKEDIQNIEGALEKVNSINGVTFVRKHNGERSAGVIAQELLEVLPEAVKEKKLALQTADGESYYVVEYDAVTGLLVEAIKELTKRVEALES